jgi:hypothetical protein
MILVGIFFILIGTQVISVYDNWSSGLLAIAIGSALIYGRYLLEKR